MDLWIIQNGEKIGPIHDFDVRKKIECGELLATTPAWHEGLSAWRPLIEISLFEREFDRPVEDHDTPYASPADDAGSPAPPPLPAAHGLIRRFWARWLDLCLFAGVWWIVLWAIGRDIEAILVNPWIILLQYVPWFVLETFLLHRLGTTPGKWLLGLKVVNDDGSLLSLADATRRSARVLCLGIGFGWSLLAPICQIMAYFTAKRLGRPLWDQTGGHRVIAAPLMQPIHLMIACATSFLPWFFISSGLVWAIISPVCGIMAYLSAKVRGTAAPLQPWRVATFVFLFSAALQLQLIVVIPYEFEAAVKLFPALKEQIEQTPIWHLPKNQ
ncbi:MAG: RDD family protein [Verrucomicrobia bacterium]|nr:RDD family protein [Verrucomicrobiota bacterium]